MMATAQASTSTWLGCSRKMVCTPGLARTAMAKLHGMMSSAGAESPLRTRRRIRGSSPSAKA